MITFINLCGSHQSHHCTSHSQFLQVLLVELFFSYFEAIAWTPNKWFEFFLQSAQSNSLVNVNSECWKQKYMILIASLERERMAQGYHLGDHQRKSDDDKITMEAAPDHQCVITRW